MGNVRGLEYVSRHLVPYSSMFVVRFQFDHSTSISWRLSSSDPLLFALPKTDRWRLLNPLRYFQLPDPSPADNFVQVAPGKMFGATDEIAFASSEVGSI